MDAVTQTHIHVSRAAALSSGPESKPRATPASFGQGLSASEAALRLRRDGPNLLPSPERRRWPRLLADVLREPMLLLLIVATLLYLMLGEASDAILLATSVAAVIALTLYQGWRSESALQALRDLSAPNAKVVRGGSLMSIPSAELVVGDHIRIAEGDRVPADASLFAADDLQLDESLLTGESVPVRRLAGSGESSTIFAGTLVVRGQGAAEVSATGRRTQAGSIGASLGVILAEPTPLQREIRRLVAWFALIGIASCVAVIALFALLRGGWLQALLAGITLAMANIPEEFPVVLTIFLALGAWRMSRQRVLIRRPAAIEALGSVTVLCTDKTGTLTENRMSVARLAVPGDEDQSDLLPSLSPPANGLLHAARMASDADGFDPMDRAILSAAATRLLASDAEWLRRYPVSPDLPVYGAAWRSPDSAGVYLACKGAPESVASLCGLDETQRTAVLAKAATMAAEGLRVIAAADLLVENDQSAAPPTNLHSLPFCWRGLLGLADPLRAEVPAAVAEARSAGLRVILMTGDHVETARSIAKAAGVSDAPNVVVGAELERLDSAGLIELLRRTDVFARVKPHHKLSLVQALKAQGEVVAMTGDGVNDAPALAAAHVGIAMGGRGTDVAREAASIVLLDDNFASIVRAVRMGRTIYDNLRRASGYIIAVHVPITGLALLPILMDMPLILLPLHVVFMEMLIDPAASIVLERERPAADLMRRPPRASSARLVDRRIFAASVSRGLLVLAAAVMALLGAELFGLAAKQASALAFAALVSGNIALIQTHRTHGRPGERANAAFNLIAAAAASILAALALMTAPAAWFGFAPVPAAALLAAAGMPWLLLFGPRWTARALGNLGRQRSR